MLSFPCLYEINNKQYQKLLTHNSRNLINFSFRPLAVKPGPKKCLNIVVVGDGDTGKTSLLMAFRGLPFDREYVPTVFETYTREMRVEGEDVELGMWDTAGQEGYDRLRPLAYPHCDAFVICYAVDSPDSLENVTAKWLPELEHFCPDVPKILVATKKDLRRRTMSIMDLLNSNEPPKRDSYEEGLCKAASIGAARFLETSALQNRGVKEVFTHTARVALNERKKRKSGNGRKEICRIL